MTPERHRNVPLFRPCVARLSRSAVKLPGAFFLNELTKLSTPDRRESWTNQRDGTNERDVGSKKTFLNHHEGYERKHKRHREL